MSAAELHDHAAAGDGSGFIALVMVALVVMATAIHLCVPWARRGCAPAGPEVGAHLVMGAAMAAMLLPNPGFAAPAGVWSAACLAAAGVALVAAGRAGGAGRGAEALHHGDLCLGSVVMAGMYLWGIAGGASGAVLGAAYALKAAAAMVVVLWRTMVIEIEGVAAVEVPSSRLTQAATLRRPPAVLTLSTPVFLAVALEGFAMAYMFVAH